MTSTWLSFYARSLVIKFDNDYFKMSLKSWKDHGFGDSTQYFQLQAAGLLALQDICDHEWRWDEKHGQILFEDESDMVKFKLKYVDV